ncbi:MAG: endonuclease domain-containing protein [bacterium]
MRRILRDENIQLSPFEKGGLRGIYKNMLQYNTNLKQYSRKLRKGMTNAEILVWSKLKSKQLKNYQFYRQKIIGDFIVDFYCPKAKLTIELDGGQHYSIEGKQKDLLRDTYLKNLGLKILRFPDNEVFSNLKGVMEKIWTNL